MKIKTEINGNFIVLKWDRCDRTSLETSRDSCAHCASPSPHSSSLHSRPARLIDNNKRCDRRVLVARSHIVV